MPYQGAALFFLVGVGIAAAAIMYLLGETDRREQPHRTYPDRGDDDDDNDYPRNSWSSPTENHPKDRRRRRNRTNGYAQICSICQDEMQEGSQLRKLVCGHSFHCRCIEKWFQVRKDCPYCRRAF